MMWNQGIVVRDNIEMPKVWNAFGYALGVHVLLFIWNPILLSGGASHRPDVLMQVEFRDKMPAIPKPPQVVKRTEPKQIVHKAHKSGLSLTSRPHAPAIIHPHPIKPAARLVSRPAPRSRPAPIKMPKFIPHASDEDAIAIAAPHTKVALTTNLRPATNPAQTAPALHGKSRGIRASDVHFRLTERTGIAGGGATVNIPIGDERGETAVVASAPTLHDAPSGVRHTSGNYYKAPLGEGVGALAGKNRKGYVASIQMGEPSQDEVIAAGNQHGSTAGHGFEIGGPVGDRRILRRHLPEYPAWAEEKGISAMVKIFFTVKADGSIRRSVRVVTSSGYSELDSLAKDALLAWKFSPTQAASSADEAWGVITFRFTLA